LRKVLIPAAAVLVVLAAAVAATAAIPDANGVIHGCRNTKSGALRVIDSEQGQTCGKDEAALPWNQAGPQGPAGVSGYQYVIKHYTGPFASGDLIVTVACPTGKSVIWSGGVSDPPKAMTRLDVTLDLNGKATTSHVGFDNAAGNITSVDATAICAVVT
jgi:hypothetical protein